MMLRLASMLNLLNDVKEEELKNKLAIDKEMKKTKKEMKKEIKILLLGAGEAGKSTFIRQMKIISAEDPSIRPFNDQEILSYKALIHQNIIQSMKKMIRAMGDLQIAFGDEDCKTFAQSIDSFNSEDEEITDEIWDCLEKLWKDSGIQECQKRGFVFNLMDSAQYFFNSIERIKSPEYRPSNQDILRSRAPTTGVVEYNFKSGQHIFKIVDVGGQRAERRKWIRCFEDVFSIIFLVAISEYNQKLEEADEHNRLVEAKMLYDNISHYEWFEKTSFIIFFNKTDLLEEKIMHSNLEDFFPEYMGPKQDVEAAKSFIRDYFLPEQSGSSSERTVYSHFTCATDKNNIEKVFEDVKHNILHKNLNYYGLE